MCKNLQASTKAIAIAGNFRAINHAWFVYNFEAYKHKECLCWENISIVVINNKIVFFVTSSASSESYSIFESTYYAINPQQ